MPEKVRRPRLLALLARHLAVGVFGAVLFFLLIVGTDLFGLRGLLSADGEGWLAGGLLLFGLIVTFGSAAMAVGVITLGPWRDDGAAAGRNRNCHQSRLE